MNFCLKGSHFTRKISGFHIIDRSKIQIFFELEEPYGLESIEISDADFDAEETPFINSIYIGNGKK